jgi:AcrR family transcriptional regulator
MDGRTARSERTKAAILLATSDAMRAGIFRPTVVEIAKAARCSARSVFQHFHTTEELYRVALEDDATHGAIWQQIVQSPNSLDPRTVVMAAVYGRIIPE